MFAYCLFCNTAKRGEVAEALRRLNGWVTICPRIVQRKWVKGTPFEVVHDFLPGYLFVYTEAPIPNPLSLRRWDHVLRCLGDADFGYQLQGSDLAFAEMLYQNEGTIGILKAYKEGDRVRLVEGALGRFEGEIIKLDRVKGRAQIQYQFDGVAYKTWVGYDMIDDPVRLPSTEK